MGVAYVATNFEELPWRPKAPPTAPRPRGIPRGVPHGLLADERVDHRFKALPPDAEGLTVGALAAERRNLFTGGFTTPVLALSAESVAHNLDLLETYAERHGLAFAPHGKTSMSPQLFADQLERGAWASRPPCHTRRGSTGRTGSADLPRQRAGRPGRPALAGRRDDGRPGVPLRLLRRLRARRRADGRGPERLRRHPPGRRGRRAGRGRGVRAPGPARRPTARPWPTRVAAAGSLHLVGVAGYEGEVPDADPERVRRGCGGSSRSRPPSTARSGSPGPRRS